MGNPGVVLSLVAMLPAPIPVTSGCTTSRPSSQLTLALTVESWSVRRRGGGHAGLVRVNRGADSSISPVARGRRTAP